MPSHLPEPAADISAIDRVVIGWKEFLDFPEWGLKHIRVKVDTGACTSALGVVSCTVEQGQFSGDRLHLHLALSRRRPDRVIHVQTPIVGRVWVKNSSGWKERRPVIEVLVRLGPIQKRIRMTVTNRSRMLTPVLLGRQALAGDFLVDVSRKTCSAVDDRPRSQKERPMRIIILSRQESLFSTRALLEAGQAHGHDVQVLDTLQFDIRLSRRNPELFYQGKPIGPVDAVIPRIGASITFFGLAVVRQFEMMGVYCLNESQAIARSRDKLRCLQLLSRHDIGMPPTIYTRQAEHIPACIEKVDGPPVVVKLLEGTQGIGVVLAESTRAASSVIEAFHGLEQNILIQKFIEEAKGADIRALVVGRKVVAAMKRQAVRGEFRSNLHRGGTAKKFRLSPEYRKTALAAARVLGLTVAGVDLIESKDGPMVMEVNSSPGLEGVQKSTGVDVADAIIEHIEQEVRIHQAPASGS